MVDDTTIHIEITPWDSLAYDADMHMQITIKLTVLQAPQSCEYRNSPTLKWTITSKNTAWLYFLVHLNSYVYSISHAVCVIIMQCVYKGQFENNNWMIGYCFLVGQWLCTWTIVWALQIRYCWLPWCYGHVDMPSLIRLWAQHKHIHVSVLYSHANIQILLTGIGYR